jgi:hypothetical protein
MKQPLMHIQFPWAQPKGFIETKTYSFDTALGKASLVTALLGDGTNMGALVDPEGHAKFFRLSPETDWAIEERGQGTWPVVIAEDMERVWALTIDAVAESNRETRAELEPASSPSQNSGDH